MFLKVTKKGFLTIKKWSYFKWKNNLELTPAKPISHLILSFPICPTVLLLMTLDRTRWISVKTQQWTREFIWFCCLSWHCMLEPRSWAKLHSIEASTLLFSPFIELPLAVFSSYLFLSYLRGNLFMFYIVSSLCHWKDIFFGINAYL
jgi:hypothetical protein